MMSLVEHCKTVSGDIFGVSSDSQFLWLSKKSAIQNDTQIKNLRHNVVHKKQGKIIGAVEHRWELTGNYSDFIVVMVFYLFYWRTKRILVTAITGFNIYILIQSLMLFI